MNKKLKIARNNGFKFIEINKLSIEIYSNLHPIHIRYYLKHRIPMDHRQFFRKISQNLEYTEKFCEDLKNPFLYGCHQWYLYNSQLKQFQK